MREYIDHDRDDMGKPLKDGKAWLPSLKYTFQAVPKPGEKSRPLTADQKQQNIVFTRECRKLWREALSEMRERVTTGVKKVEKKTVQGEKGRESRESRGKEEAESKSKADGEGESKDARGRNDRDGRDGDSKGTSAGGSRSNVPAPGEQFSNLGYFMQLLRPFF